LESRNPTAPVRILKGLGESGYSPFSPNVLLNTPKRFRVSWCPNFHKRLSKL